MIRPRIVACLAAAAVFTQSVSSLADPPGPDSGSADAGAGSDRLFYEGIDLLDQGKTAEACDRFDASLRLRRRGGTLLNLALCREALGQLVTALPLFEEALDHATAAGRTDREEIARRHIADLRAKLAWITLRFAPGAEVPGLAITCNGAPVPPDQWQSPIAIMPGTLVVAAAAPGKVRFEQSPTLVSAGDERSVEIPVLPPAPVPAPEIAPPRAPPPRPAPDTAPMEYDLSHRWQVGAIARLDVDPLHPGARAALGLTFGLGESFEIGASALLGKDVGVEPQLTFFVLGRSAYKPLVNVGAPIFFFADRAYPGIRGALGFQWDLNRHLGAFLLVGGAYFPEVPEDWARAIFLPAAGLQGRL